MVSETLVYLIWIGLLYIVLTDNFSMKMADTFTGICYFLVKL